MLTHHGGDLNFDQCRARQAVVTACRPQPGFPVSTQWSFEVAPSTEWRIPNPDLVFLPTAFVDVSGCLERKLEALDTYHAEIPVLPDTYSRRAFEAPARWRNSTVGVEAGEAVVVQGVLT